MTITPHRSIRSEATKRKTAFWVYLSDKEREVIQEAAGIMHVSDSLFTADAAARRADDVLKAYKRGVTDGNRRRRLVQEEIESK